MESLQILKKNEVMKDDDQLILKFLCHLEQMIFTSRSLHKSAIVKHLVNKQGNLHVPI